MGFFGRLGAAALVGALTASGCAPVAPGEGEPVDVAADELSTAGVALIEVKVSVQEQDIEQAEDALELDSHGREGDVFFFDDPELSLSARGVVVRARHREGDDDATVKLRPIKPSSVPSTYKALHGFKCEGDRAGGKTVVSCSLSHDVSGGDIADVADGKRALASLLNGEQETFPLAGGKGDVDWSSLRALGPVSSVAWKVKRLGIDLAAERWTLPNGERFLELST